ncbi:MAG: hypothetical protein IKB46_00275 [Paludibacteraceae bacterium]|nr:hypothetical protein [Paludibacteraceae bacterium]
MEVVIPVGLINSSDLQIVSPYILPTQTIEFETGTFTAVDNITTHQPSAVKYLQDGHILIQRGNKRYTVTGQVIE